MQAEQPIAVGGMRGMSRHQKRPGSGRKEWFGVRRRVADPVETSQVSSRWGHAGQTLVLALSVMFLLVFIGALFVAIIARNLGRVEFTGSRTTAQSLAESGLNWVNNQLTYSELGADWRPTPTWPSPGTGAKEQQRLLDPDYPWLSDKGTYLKPWTRIASGDGRFLIRVDYEPSYRSTNVPDPAVFDPLSSHLHIQVVGRPGQIADDPTLLLSSNNPNWKPGQIYGAYHELEGWKPMVSRISSGGLRTSIRSGARPWSVCRPTRMGSDERSSTTRRCKAVCAATSTSSSRGRPRSIYLPTAARRF